MTSKDYIDFDEALVAPMLGISRDTEEREADDWDSFAAVMDKFG